MPYEIIITRDAKKEFRKLPNDVQENIFDHISNLKVEPRPSGCKKLKGEIDYWRIRVGKYRVIYSIEDNILRIEVIKIGHRKDVYKK
jgi:mRNA interferase RelE/StbE